MPQLMLCACSCRPCKPQLFAGTTQAHLLTGRLMAGLNHCKALSGLPVLIVFSTALVTSCKPSASKQVLA